MLFGAMYFNHLVDDQTTASLFHGIYPILKCTPDSDLDSLLDWAIKLPDGGIKLVQVRAKRFADEALPGVLDELIGNLRGAGLTVILNDYVELATITGADGVHVGLDDFPVFEARALLGPRAIIGATCRHSAEALLAIGQGATYVAVGSIFESPTKGGLPLIGLKGLKKTVEEIANEVSPRIGWGRFDANPVVAIGGINQENLAGVYEAGASMVAVVSAIQETDDPLKAAKALVDCWNNLPRSS